MDTDHVTEKRFPCSYPGCNKRFTRAEHMHRHALNHTSGDYTCQECRAHFKRPDLLCMSVYNLCIGHDPT